MVSESVYKDLDKKNIKSFKEVIKWYDMGMYKKSFKKCETILTTQPNHSETIAMKALIYNTVGKKKEAKETINKALMCNLKSFTSWHIKGMIDRTDKNLSDAKKCFAQCARIEGDNQKMLRDLLHLELHDRDYKSAGNTISSIMEKQSRNKVFCTAYFLLSHLNGDYESAENFIEANKDFLVSKLSRIELNEFYLYEATLYMDDRKYEQAIKVLKDQATSIVDKTTRFELLVEAYIKTGNTEEAMNYLEELLKRNPSCVKYYHNFLKIVGIDIDNIDEEGEKKVTEFLEKQIEKHPNLLFLKRLHLNYLIKEETFRPKFEAYCKYMLDKGIPSLVNDIENMINKNSMKFKIVKETFEKYLESMKTDLTIDGEEQDPLQECFLLFFLSQINYIEGDYIKALDLVKQSIENTPTFFEAWQFKAKILVRLGNTIGAEKAYKKAMNLDTADRFLNAECAKYVLLNGKQEEANNIMKRWSVDTNTNEITSFEYQNVWYEVETAYSFIRQNRFLEAFQMFYFIERHLVTMLHDFYDFHFYSIRKFMLRTYMNIGKMQDSLRRNTNIQNGMIGMLKILDKFYKKLNDPSEEKVKEFKEWMETQAKLHKEVEVDVNSWEAFEKPADQLGKIDDPTSAKALKKILDSNVTLEAAKRCTDNLRFNPENQILHYHAVKWNLRAKNFESALKSLQYLNSKHPNCYNTIYANARFRLFFSSEANKSLLKGKVAETVNQFIETTFGDQDASTYFENKTKNDGANSLEFQRTYIKGAIRLFNESITKSHLQNVFEILDKAIKDEKFKVSILKDLKSITKIIKSAPEDLKEQLIEIADQVFYKFKKNYNRSLPTSEHLKEKVKDNTE